MWELCAKALPEADVRRGQNLFIYYHNVLGNGERRFEMTFEVQLKEELHYELAYDELLDMSTSASTQRSTPPSIDWDNGTTNIACYYTPCSISLLN